MQALIGLDVVARKIADVEPVVDADMIVHRRDEVAGKNPQTRVAAFRIWPEDDLPRTHTLKIKRDVVRRWAAVDEPLPVREGQ